MTASDRPLARAVAGNASPGQVADEFGEFRANAVNKFEGPGERL